MVEDLLDRHPELAQEPEAVLELISEEIYLRMESGEEVRPADLVRRFPRWARQVQALCDCHQMLAAPLGTPQFPAPGETLDDFALLAELGRGAQARVFLARQSALADRLVVLKCTPRLGQEHLSLARLQHTHIVPLYSVHDFPSRGLRALCLPYFGGATLDRLLALLAERPPEQRHGRDLVEALRRWQASSAPLPVSGPACQFLARASYVEAVCWVGACLAEALQYAQERGLVHLDLKPSNVLLSAEGQPMLLDFHLARQPLQAGQMPPAWLGGTPGYMAPEQQRALEAVQRRQTLPTSVDHRADLHALGLLLGEMLGVQRPEKQAVSARLLRRSNPQVTPGLADLLARCLAPDPRERYPTAGALARDLRRHLADLPLHGVVNRSLTERWRKWRRRRPLTLPLLGLTLAGLLGAGFLAAHVARQTDKASAALVEGQRQLEQQRYVEARATLEHGIALIEDLPGQGDLLGRLHQGIDQTERARAADQLHRFCERIRPLYGIAQVPPGQLRAVSKTCAEFWDRRDLLRQEPCSFQDPLLRQQVQADLLDLAILWAHLRVRLSPATQSREAHRQALDFLELVEKELGPSCVLDQERRLHGQVVGQAGALAPTRPAQTAWEHAALGRACFHAGDLPSAQAHLERALALQPRSLWVSFYQGSCAFRLGEMPEAVAAFSVCVMLAPESAWCYYNRGLARTQLGQDERALRDFDRALAIDPMLAAGYLARGTLHYRQKRYPQAQADLEAALHHGLDGASVSYNLALVHLARDDAPSARACLERALEHEPEHVQAKQLLDHLRNPR
jgi:serine/threonine protein kinase/Tfp pilus assembly protein PilF